MLNLGTLAGVLALDTGPFSTALKKSEGEFEGTGQRLKMAAATVAVAVGAALAAGFVKGLELDQANAKLTAQLRLTEDESARVGALAGELYANAYGESIEEVNTAIQGVIAQVGGLGQITDQELSQASAAALNLANIMGTDVSRVVQVAGQAVSTGLASDFEEAFDLIAAASAETMPGLEDDLLDAIDEYGPFFQTLGIQGDAAFGMLAAASKKGMYGIDKTGDAIKEFTLLATDMSTSSVAAFESMGLNADQMAQDILAGGDTASGAFNQIVSALLAIEDPVEQASTSIALFGTPLEDLSVSEIPTFLESLTSAETGLTDVAGAADEMGGKLRDNASTNIDSFMNTMQMAFVDIAGGTVIPIIMSLAGWLKDNLGPAFSAAAGVISDNVIPALVAVIGWFQENQTWVMIVAGLITAVFVPAWIAMGVQATIAGAKTAAAWVMQKASAIGAVAVQSAQIAIMVGKWVLMGTTAMINGAKMAAAWVLGMGPIGWIIAAVVAAVALIIYYWDEIVAGLEAAWNWISDIAVNVWNGILAFFEEWGWLVFAVLTGGISLVVGWIVENWDAIAAKTEEIFTAIGEFFSMIWEFILQVIDDHIEMIKGVLAWFGGLGAKFAEWFNKAKDGAIDKLKALINWAKGVPGDILKALGNIGSFLLQAGKDLLNGLWNGMKNVSGDILNWIWGLLEDMGSAVLEFFGIASPSKLFTYYGEMLGAGLGKGIRQSISGVVASAELMAEAAIPALRVPEFGPTIVNSVTSLAERDRDLLMSAVESARSVNFHVDARGSKYGPEEMRRDMALAEV